MLDQIDDVRGQTRTFADNPKPHAVLVEVGDLAAQIEPQQEHQLLDLLDRTAPILGRKTEDRQIRNLQSPGGFNDPAHRFHAAAMTGGTEHSPCLRPTAIAVHDDGDMPRPGIGRKFGGGGHQICLISFSFDCSDSSTFLMCWSVNRCTSADSFSCSSSEISLSFSSRFSISIPSRRTF